MDMETEELELMLFRYKEGLMTPDERNECEAYLAAHHEAQRLASLYDPALKATKERVSFPNKESLKRGAARTRPLAWRHAAAACIAMALAGATYLALRGADQTAQDNAPVQLAQARTQETDTETRPMDGIAPAREGGEEATTAGTTMEHTRLYKASTRRDGATPASTAPVEMALADERQAMQAEEEQRQGTEVRLVRYEDPARSMIAYVDAQDEAQGGDDAEWQTDADTASLYAQAKEATFVQRLVRPFRQYGKEKWEQGAKGVKAAKDDLGEMLAMAESTTEKLWNTAVAAAGRSKKQ